jgi:RNA 2',3'-cyclic 3'-phosphodiesterase
MRVFFGLELDAATVLRVADWRDRQLACSGRSVPPANFHITLAFVGPLRDAAIARLCQAVDEWRSRSTLHGATLHLDSTGYWPKPGIYWLGPTAWPEQLAGLAQKLKILATAAGSKLDRNPFHPHITLFRHCSSAPPAPTQAPAFDLTYQHFALFESRQGKHGVSYHILRDWDLSPAP